MSQFTIKVAQIFFCLSCFLLVLLYNSGDDDPMGLAEKAPLANTGNLFKAGVDVSLPRVSPKYRGMRLSEEEEAAVSDGSRTSCKLWAVLTTVFSPSEAVRRFLYKKEWCVVIVGDRELPVGYRFNTTMGSNLIFLSAEDQEAIGSRFVSGLPWNSFGRKNVGYLYAIAGGAEMVWDFDDDNMLKFWMEGASPDEWLDLSKLAGKDRNGEQHFSEYICRIC